MKKDLSKRVETLSTERQKLFELLLNKNASGKETSARKQLFKTETGNSLKNNQTQDDELITDHNVLRTGNHEKKELPLKLTRKITSFLGRAFTLNIVLAEERMCQWYYQHFVQLCSQTDSMGYTIVDFAEPGFLGSDVVTVEDFMGYQGLKDTPNISEHIIQKIDADSYVIICLDEYYLSEKSKLSKGHFVHESLIYGYNDLKREFLALGFNAEMFFDKYTINYDVFMKAYEEGKLHYKKFAPYADKCAVIYLRSSVKPDTDYVFDMDIFLGDLDKYLHSVWDADKVFLYASINDEETTRYGEVIKYGIEIYDVLLAKLENLLHREITVDYRAFHVIAEHKKIMYEKFQHIASCYDITDEIAELFREYLGVVKQFEDIRRISLGIAYSRNGLQEQNIDVVRELIPTIKAAREKEISILTQIYESLERGFGSEHGS